MVRNKFISVRLTESEREQVLKMAKEWGVRRSEVLRFCLRSVLLGRSGVSPDLARASSDQTIGHADRS